MRVRASPRAPPGRARRAPFPSLTPAARRGGVLAHPAPPTRTTMNAVAAAILAVRSASASECEWDAGEQAALEALLAKLAASGRSMSPLER